MEKMSVLRIILVSATVLGIYGGANFYAARRLFQWLSLLVPQINAKIYAGIYILAALSLFLGFTPLPPVIKRLFGGIGAYYMGIFMYLLLFFLLADFIVLLGNVTKILPSSQSVLFYKGLAAVLLTACVVCYGLFNANRIQHISYDVYVDEPSLDNMKIVLIADSHLGAANNFERSLERIVQDINAIEPDIVCWAGDIFNDDFHAIRNPGKAASLLRGIEASYGVFACLGNHDGGPTLNLMTDFLKNSNITLLNDDYAVIDGRLALFGRMDSRPIGGGPERQDISGAIDSVNLPVIVMEHNPSHIGEYGGEVFLLLAGHTHKGQLFPGRLFTRALFEADYGYYQKDPDSPQVVITSGVSTWGPPMRVGTHNEIVSIVLRKR
jgi:hypothetical protein